MRLDSVLGDILYSSVSLRFVHGVGGGLGIIWGGESPDQRKYGSGNINVTTEIFHATRVRLTQQLATQKMFQKHCWRQTRSETHEYRNDPA